jgi:hypothetical protein
MNWAPLNLRIELSLLPIHRRLRECGSPGHSLERVAIACVGQFAKLSHYHRSIAAVCPYTQLQPALVDSRYGLNQGIALRTGLGIVAVPFLQARHRGNIEGNFQPAR